MRLLRLVTGLVVASFITGHFLNHSLGVVSIEAMDELRGVLSAWWRSPVGTVVLYGSLLTHFALALVSLYRRTTLRMPAWEAAQLVLGLAVPPLLIYHVVATRFNWWLFGNAIGYERVVAGLWADPWAAGRQCLLLVIAWAHLCFGLHYWLRLRPWYPNAQPAAFAAALLIPALALAGFVAAGFNHNPNLPAFATEQRALLVNWRGTLLLTFFALLAVTLLARWLRSRIGGTYQLRLSSGRVVTAPVGRSILEALRDEGIPHASVCGGRARCTTCRVRVGDGLAKLAAPAPLEAQALARIDAPPNVRLACQARPRSDVAVAPLLPPGAGPATARRPGAPQGRERPVVAMFVDLRESTKLCESRLPYDAVFIMNQFFAEMHDALRATNGYYAQFRGDGLLALYGLDSDLPRACRDALRGAAEMQARIERLSASLADELAEPMRIGIGLHAGVAIVGTMGPPAEPIHSAIGDNINIAARFEGMTKIYHCVLVVSAETLKQAGVDPKDSTLHHVRVRGRNERVDVYAVADPRSLISA
jgi:adenylate cyclase